MKRVLCILLLVSALLGCCSCGTMTANTNDEKPTESPVGNNSGNNQNGKPTPSPTPSPNTTELPNLSPDNQPSPLLPNITPSDLMPNFEK